MTDIEQEIKHIRVVNGLKGFILGLLLTLAFSLFLTLAFSLFLYSCKPAHAASANEFEIVFEWEYTTQPDLTGFHLYQDGTLLADIPDKATRTLTKKTILPNAKACFTMTAYGVTEDMESPRSAEYCIKRPLAAPVMAMPKYYRQYIQAGPVNTSPTK
jgi:hypothetical protein